MKKLLGVLTLGLLVGCASGEANKIPYKYRTEAQVDRDCRAMQAKYKDSKGYASESAGTNFAMGVIEQMRIDMACDPLKK
jgi:type IV pilus biogenesis protein CpaD/CtpE